MAPLLSSEADGDVAAEEAIDDALPAEDVRRFDSADGMYEAGRGRGQAGRLLLPALVGRAASGSDSDSESGGDDGAFLASLVRARLVLRERLEREGRARTGFPADRGDFALSFLPAVGTLYADVGPPIDEARGATHVAIPGGLGVTSRVYCDDHLMRFGARGDWPTPGSVPEMGWVERPLAFPGTDVHRIRFLLDVSLAFGLRRSGLAAILSEYSFEELGAILRRGWMRGGNLVLGPPAHIRRARPGLRLEYVESRSGWPQGGAPDPVAAYSGMMTPQGLVPLPNRVPRAAWGSSFSDASQSGYGFQVLEE